MVRGWTCFDGGRRFNDGAPAINSIIVTDVGTDVANFPTECPECGNRIDGAALHIDRNVIASAWAFAPGQLIEGAPAVHPGVRDLGESVQIPASEVDTWWAADYYLPQGDGTWKPMSDWEFRTFDYIDS